VSSCLCSMLAVLFAVAGGIYSAFAPQFIATAALAVEAWRAPSPPWLSARLPPATNRKAGGRAVQRAGRMHRTRSRIAVWRGFSARQYWAFVRVRANCPRRYGGPFCGDRLLPACPPHPSPPHLAPRPSCILFGWTGGRTRFGATCWRDDIMADRHGGRPAAIPHVFFYYSPVDIQRRLNGRRYGRCAARHTVGL